VMLFLRPIYVLSLCDLYSEYLESKCEVVELPENPKKSVSALVAFGIVCLLLAVTYLYRSELGVVDMLSTPYAQRHEAGTVQASEAREPVSDPYGLAPYQE